MRKHNVNTYGLSGVRRKEVLKNLIMQQMEKYGVMSLARLGARTGFASSALWWAWVHGKGQSHIALEELVAEGKIIIADNPRPITVRLAMPKHNSSAAPALEIALKNFIEAVKNHVYQQKETDDSTVEALKKELVEKQLTIDNLLSRLEKQEESLIPKLFNFNKV
ncbi:MAG: hypothetical protein A4E53_01707 [Pelotomaculum sp. PtaB.Bin104]|nr:MAG: hypothetical protein A4E53_01707 [Pelotomaculum sp. PtaB.Bin104]